jgi:hypothetical protein
MMQRMMQSGFIVNLQRPTDCNYLSSVASKMIGEKLSTKSNRRWMNVAEAAPSMTIFNWNKRRINEKRTTNKRSDVVNICAILRV